MQSKYEQPNQWYLERTNPTHRQTEAEAKSEKTTHTVFLQATCQTLHSRRRSMSTPEGAIHIATLKDRLGKRKRQAPISTNTLRRSFHPAPRTEEGNNEEAILQCSRLFRRIGSSCLGGGRLSGGVDGFGGGLGGGLGLVLLLLLALELCEERFDLGLQSTSFRRLGGFLALLLRELDITFAAAL